METVDATGLGMLLGADRRAKLAGRRLVLRDAGPRLLRLLRATRLHRVLTVDEAVAGLRTAGYRRVVSPGIGPRRHPSGTAPG